jgi:hypothetical protein
MIKPMDQTEPFQDEVASSQAFLRLAKDFSSYCKFSNSTIDTIEKRYLNYSYITEDIYRGYICGYI